MQKVRFRKGKNTEVTFEKSPDLIAVRSRTAQSVLRGPVTPAASSALTGGNLVAQFPDAGVAVYRVPTGKGHRSLEVRKVALRSDADVRFAGGVMVDTQMKEPVVYTENLFVTFVDSADRDDCRAVLRDLGLSVKEEVAYATNAFFVGTPEGTGTKVFDIAQDLLQRKVVEFCHPEIVRQKRSRTISATQWYMKSTVVNGVSVAASANIEAAHLITRGEGATIAIIDDGVDIDHPEFGSAGKLVAPRDASQGSSDPRPKFASEKHGTACAGVACADGSQGASGVAPGAKLMPIRFSAALGSMQEAEAFRWAADHGADVISCSWGPEDGDWFDSNDPRHDRVVSLPASTKLAIDYALSTGRGGKGCVILFAAGNGNEDVNNDGYASDDNVTAVAACNDRGKRSVYSDFGAAAWCSFPSSDFGFAALSHPNPITPGIWTTDRVGYAGYSIGNVNSGDPQGNYTTSFGGTSSARPGAAGVAALILSVNSNLRWHEVKDILRKACVRIDSQGGNYDVDGRSPWYGYGRLNAQAAVQLARGQALNSASFTNAVHASIVDFQTTTADILVGEDHPLDSLSVSVEIAHTYIGDLTIDLLPPAELGLGSIRLHDRAGGNLHNIRRVYDAVAVPTLAALAGQSPAGVWRLQVSDLAEADHGTLIKFMLDIVFDGSIFRAVRTPNQVCTLVKSAKAKTREVGLPTRAKRATKRKARA